MEVAQTERVVEQVRVEVPTGTHPRGSSDYTQILYELAMRLDTGRIYERDLGCLTSAMTSLIDAFNRRYR